MYANVIIDISHEKLDRTFQYRIPERLLAEITAGVQVLIPFGNSKVPRKGYVIEVREKAEFDPEKTKEIIDVVRGSVSLASQQIRLAWWMKERYGSTMKQALKTVLPVKQQVRQKEKKVLKCLLSREELELAVAEAARKHYKARERLLRAFTEMEEIPYEMVTGQMNLTAASMKPLVEKGIISVEAETMYRNPEISGNGYKTAVSLNPAQTAVAEDFKNRYDQGIRETSLLYGVTGSGKTEVYMEMIRHVLAKGRQVIVLIPEIALTYQTVLRFYRQFGRQVSVINSRMSAGERYDQFERAEKGDVTVMIGPRSALFTPFPKLGLIVIDEEHESAYKSELSPRYHARETAEELARMNGASVVLGSATPSLEAYTRAKTGQYRLYRLAERAKKDSHMAKVSVVDLREELKRGNKSIFSVQLREAMEERLKNHEQIMLFLNRRGYSTFVSCRSCGEAIRCPHCDVTLTLHRNQHLKCHYCGYEIPVPPRCPSCGSPYIAGFGTGTQKIETMVKQVFPEARVLRMDRDTTSQKGGHEEILSAFAEGGADILVGTQMIVKGHDFPNVTLVGILAADLSLYSSDFRCGERTFQLLTQAAGRAGRGEKPGEVIIQTYSPEQYSITCAADQDYDSFYTQEMAYRQILHYPPVFQLLTVMIAAKEEPVLDQAAKEMRQWVKEMEEGADVELIGPTEATVYKVHDIYRKILYLKKKNYDILIRIKDRLEEKVQEQSWNGKVMIQFDFA